MAQQFNTSFQIGLGDNFYDEGVLNSDDNRFKVRIVLEHNINN